MINCTHAARCILGLLDISDTTVQTVGQKSNYKTMSAMCYVNYSVGSASLRYVETAAWQRRRVDVIMTIVEKTDFCGEQRLLSRSVSNDIQ